MTVPECMSSFSRLRRTRHDLDYSLEWELEKITSRQVWKCSYSVRSQ
jgi:hypothetical protein